MNNFDIKILRTIGNVLLPIIHQFLRDNCEACAVDDLSQTKHTCLTIEFEESYDIYFERAIEHISSKTLMPSMLCEIRENEILKSTLKMMVCNEL